MGRLMNKINRFYVLLPSLNAVYIVVGKTGCSSVKYAISKFHSKNINVVYDHKSEKVFNYGNVHNVTPHQSDWRRINEITANKFVFSFVRSPFTRVASCWYDKIIKNPKTMQYLDLPLVAGMSFEDFINAICKIPDKCSDPHFAGQTYLISNNKKVILPNFIGKFETMAKDWSIINKKLSNKLPVLENLNNSQNNDDYYNSIYTTDLRKKVYNRYKEDFERWYPDENPYNTGN